ncbi:hypothetical protein [Halorubrum halodurans]
MCLLRFRRDDRLVHQLDVSFREPIDELSAVPFPIGGGSLVFGVDPFAVGVDISFVTDQPNSFLEGCACDRKGKVLDVAHVDEVVRIALEVRIDPIPSTEALFRREVLGESEGDVDIGRLVRLSPDSGAEQDREADVRLREIPADRRHVHAVDRRPIVIRSGHVRYLRAGR